MHISYDRTLTVNSIWEVFDYCGKVLMKQTLSDFDAGKRELGSFLPLFCLSPIPKHIQRIKAEQRPPHSLSLCIGGGPTSRGGQHWCTTAS